MSYKMPGGNLYIGGEFQAGTGAEITSVFSADGSENVIFKGASTRDVETAIARAKDAWQHPAWYDLKPHERSAYLYNIADGIRKNIAHIAYIQTRDTGKTIGETTALAQSAAATFQYYGAVLETADETLTTRRGGAMTYSIYEPMGVVSAITPWNSPIASDAQKIAPALAAGNAVVLKPASWSPLVSLKLAEIIDQARLPKGLFSVLPGTGSRVGNTLVEHPDIARVSFTGGTATGRQIAEKSAQKIMPVSLELGGKSPTIVFDDCHIDQALAGVLFGIFSSTGQSCIAGSRLFIQETIYDTFLKNLIAHTGSLRVGNPFDTRTQVAPLIHFKHREHVERYVDIARQEGGKIVTGGYRPTGAKNGTEYDKGAYFMPTIITGLDNTAHACRAEIFGPVLVVMPFKDETDVIAMSNDNDYGLACGVWSSDHNKCWRVARAIKAGTVWINTYKQFSISTPFGGDGMSGIGREKGREGLRAYQNQKSVYYDITGDIHPWARI